MINSRAYSFGHIPIVLCNENIFQEILLYYASHSSEHGTLILR
jgi:hypothetical protein